VARAHTIKRKEVGCPGYVPQPLHKLCNVSINWTLEVKFQVMQLNKICEKSSVLYIVTLCLEVDMSVPKRWKDSTNKAASKKARVEILNEHRPNTFH